MLELIDSLLEISGMTLLLVLSGSIALLLLTIAMRSRRESPPQKPLDAVLSVLAVSGRAFWTAVGEGWRGYFAPLRFSPWKAAWQALRQPDRSWLSPCRAWFAEVERIVWRH